MNKYILCTSAYKIKTKREGIYIVTLIRLHNSTCGCPRYEAYITYLTRENIKKDYISPNTHIFRFTGHYFGEYKESQYIVDEYEKTLK